MTWVNEHLFAVYWMNRVQNRTVLTLCQTKGLKPCQEIFQYAEPNGWIEYKYRVHFDPLFGMSDSVAASPMPEFVTILPDRSMEHQWRQLVAVHGTKKTFLTSQGRKGLR